jgi:hypothetical protein
MAVETFNGIVVMEQGIQVGNGVNSGIKNVHNQQAPAIADATGAAGANPTQAEYAELVAKFNALLRAVRSGTGVGIIASA